MTQVFKQSSDKPSPSILISRNVFLKQPKPYSPGKNSESLKQGKGKHGIIKKKGKSMILAIFRLTHGDKQADSNAFIFICYGLLG